MINYSGLFHVSEEPGIQVFKPRPSPSVFNGINGHVVFAVWGKLLHNYLLPRDCPRVCYYASLDTSVIDKDKFIGFSKADYIITAESAWYNKIKETTLYCYEFPVETFKVVDACAGYYVSDEAVVPLNVYPIEDILDELLKRNVELRFTPSLIKLAEAVSKSTLQFSNIRMRNARD